MERVIETIKEAILKPMEEMNIIIDDVYFEKENNYDFLKIVLDRINGIDLDTIVEATNIINPIIDKLNIPLDDYILDISSKERG